MLYTYVMLKTSQVAKLFHKSPMTIGRWVDSFGSFLSHTAQSTDGTERRFSADDLRVLSLVWQMREQGNEFELITVALASGERAEPPQVSAITPTPPDSALALQSRIIDLEIELAAERAQRHKAEGQIELLERQLEKAQERLFRREW